MINIIYKLSVNIFKDNKTRVLKIIVDEFIKKELEDKKKTSYAYMKNSKERP